eukprot:scaffold109914_cov63-Phaeocystis_antarctica.AAC.8
MWFNGWLCDLAPVAAAACGRSRLYVRLLWSVVAQFPTRKWRVMVGGWATASGLKGVRVEGRVGGRAESGGAAPW